MSITLTPELVDQRSLALAQTIVARIDQGNIASAIEKAKMVCSDWLSKNPCKDLETWQEILERDWEVIREKLLSFSEEGRRLRQSHPFVGVLTPRERWMLLKDWKRSLQQKHDSATA